MLGSRGQIILKTQHICCEVVPKFQVSSMNESMILCKISFNWCKLPLSLTDYLINNSLSKQSAQIGADWNRAGMDGWRKYIYTFVFYFFSQTIHEVRVPSAGFLLKRKHTFLLLLKSWLPIKKKTLVLKD